MSNVDLNKQWPISFSLTSRSKSTSKHKLEQSKTFLVSCNFICIIFKIKVIRTLYSHFHLFYQSWFFGYKWRFWKPIIQSDEQYNEEWSSNYDERLFIYRWSYEIHNIGSHYIYINMDRINVKAPINLIKSYHFRIWNNGLKYRLNVDLAIRMI